MSSDEKIVKIIESLQQGQEVIKQRVDKSDNNQVRLITAVEAVRAGIDDVQTKQEELRAGMQVGFQALRGEIGKPLRSHERRLNTIEDELNIPHPEKH